MAKGQRSVMGVLLVLGASYALYVYDTGRFSLLKAAVVGPPGVSPLVSGLAPVSGATPQVYPSTPMIAPPTPAPLTPQMQQHGLPPALPSVGGIGPASWLSNVQSIIASIWPTKPAAPAYTPPIIGGSTSPTAAGPILSAPSLPSVWNASGAVWT